MPQAFQQIDLPIRDDHGVDVLIPVDVNRHDLSDLNICRDEYRSISPREEQGLPGVEANPHAEVPSQDQIHVTVEINVRRLSHPSIAIECLGTFNGPRRQRTLVPHQNILPELNPGLSMQHDIQIRPTDLLHPRRVVLHGDVRAIIVQVSQQKPDGSRHWNIDQHRPHSRSVTRPDRETRFRQHAQLRLPIERHVR